MPYFQLIIPSKFLRILLVSLVIFALIGISPIVDASHFYGVQLAVDLIQNTTAGIVTVYFHWREIWNAVTTVSTASFVVNCQTGSICPSGPSSMTMDSGTSNCQQTVSSASKVQYDSRTGEDTSTYFPLSSIPASRTPATYYSMGFSDSAWGLIQDQSSAFGSNINVMISRRIDTGLFDNSPRSAIAPIVTITPACGGTGFQIPYYDPDGDPVQCRWGNTALECQDVCMNSYSITLPFTLSTSCYLTYTGGLPASKVYYPIAIMLEDFYPSMPTTKMDSAPLQFVVEVGPSSGTCTAVTPLVVDSCSSALAPVAICPTKITNAPANSYVSSSYYTILPNATANLTCNLGYSAKPTSDIYMICSGYNATVGVWTAVGYCTIIPNYCNSNPNATVSNSVVVGSFGTTVSSTATVGCAIGYSGSGSSSTATCTSYNVTTGYWGGLTYSCTLNPNYCPANPPGEPTFYVGSTTRTIYSSSTLGCALGYKAAATGYPVYYCGPYDASNGVYTLISGDCVLIPNYCTAAPNATVSNSVIVGTYGTELSNTSTVGCAVGYAASGTSSTATCTASTATNGQWSGLVLTCTLIPNYCPVSPPGEPTYYVGSTNQVIYTHSTLGCALGYQADSTGYPVYYCGPYDASNGVYTHISGDCVLIPNYCTLAPNETIPNSVIVGSYGRELSNTSTVGCAIGYAASGSSSTATCSTHNVTNGKWTGLYLICTLIPNYCPGSPPGEPTYYVGSTNQIIYTHSTLGCALGYQADSTGYPVYYCGPYNASNGVYTLVSGDCVMIPNYCTSAPNATVSNSVIVGTYGTELSNTSTVGCAIGYAGSGSSSTATCSTYNVTNGQWSGLDLTCTLIPDYCPVSPPGEPTYYVGSTNQIIYTNSTLDCALGYQADSTGYPMYYCRPYNASNGVYTLFSGDCILISNYCTSAPNATVSNSVIVGTYGTELSNTSIVDCAIGYAAGGNSSIATCAAYNVTNGQWSGLDMECTLIADYCSEYPPGEPSYYVGSFNRTIYTFSTLSCAFGYKEPLAGVPVYYCGPYNATNGSYSLISGDCLPIPGYCAAQPNASVTHSTLPSAFTSAINDQVTVGCALGYEAVGGSMVATCAAYNATDGSWSGPFGNCSLIEKYCASNPGDSTTVLPSNLGHQLGTLANLTCASGYMAKSDGAPVYLCVVGNSTAGSWSLLSGSCVAIPTTKPKAIEGEVTSSWSIDWWIWLVIAIGVTFVGLAFAGVSFGCVIIIRKIKERRRRNKEISASLLPIRTPSSSSTFSVSSRVPTLKIRLPAGLR